MLGLKKGTVQVVPYHPEWSTLFSHERSVLHHCFECHFSKTIAIVFEK